MAASRNKSEGEDDLQKKGKVKDCEVCHWRFSGQEGTATKGDQTGRGNHAVGGWRGTSKKREAENRGGHSKEAELFLRKGESRPRTFLSFRQLLKASAGNAPKSN